MSPARPQAARKPRTYHGHETARMQALEGTPLASFGARAGAFLIDFALAAVVAAGLEIAYRILVRHEKDVHVKVDFHEPVSFVVIGLYFGLSVYFWKGRTLGKRLFRIRVVSVAHEHLSFWHALERAMGYGASALEAGLGFLQYFTDPNCRTVHDRIAGTIVVRERPPERSAPSLDS